MDTNANLFGQDIASHMQGLFERYVAHRSTVSHGTREQRALRPESVDVYRDMWSSFTSYCLRFGIDFAHVDVQDLDEFLTYCSQRGSTRQVAGKLRGPVTLRYKFRLLSFINKMLTFYAQTNSLAPNESAKQLLEHPRYKYANTDEFDPEANILAMAHIWTLMRHIHRCSRLAMSPQPGSDPIDWQQLRTCAAIAIHLGCGLTSQELRCLRVRHIHLGQEPHPLGALPWKIHVVALGTGVAHDVPIPPFAQRALRAWLHVREIQLAKATSGALSATSDDVDRDFAFNGKPGGTQWSKQDHRHSCNALMASLDITSSRGGVFQLRHTFAVLQLRVKRRPIDEVQAWMGLKTPAELQRYQRVVLEKLALAN